MLTEKVIIKYWYVPIVVVVLLMLIQIVQITIQSVCQRSIFWLLFVALITLPVSWIYDNGDDVTDVKLSSQKLSKMRRFSLSTFHVQSS